MYALTTLELGGEIYHHELVLAYMLFLCSVRARFGPYLSGCGWKPRGDGVRPSTLALLTGSYSGLASIAVSLYSRIHTWEVSRIARAYLVLKE